ncbi:MAG TPA: glutamate--tRNA ligase [Planctomycetes bacterium]|nr:glutamate--tRNA ligase [Planctomycetota bacterium]
MTTRLRYAPSPTGFLHIGGARTALFNWAYARRTGGVFVLRIEDTDRARSTDEYEEAILEGMRWLGMDWDEGPGIGGPFGPYRQTERFDRYERVAAELLASGAAYRCFCDSARLDALRTRQREAGETPAYDGTCRDLALEEAERRAAAGEPFTVRFRVPKDGETLVQDLVCGEVRFPNADVDDWIMVRTDGTPTYNFCVVCDDSHMRITHVLRGEEHLTNTPKQVLLFEALGLEPPAFAHLPLMLGNDGKKLSKRTGDTSLQDYRDKGYPAAAVMNFLCLQGWGLDETTTIFSLDDLVRHFDPKDVRKGGSVFDPKKFLWMAGEYLRRESLEELATHCAPFVVAAGLATEEELAERAEWFRAVLATERERIQLYSELPARIAYLFQDDDAVVYDPKAEKNARKHEGRIELLETYLEWLRPRLDPLDVDAVREATKAFVAERELRFPALFQPLRCALMGAAGGADLFDVMALLGPERVERRIRAAMERLA